ncbi:Por secretion system C-terminal sorting domain-containing protein [Lishizhenia tianjinensis]|uniref:Por secretion system C-terminal sorting domain-containing protein n=1 Tax=Lishizhenia tianjinensis TaxID=477690 RepID=A0A1I6Y0R7_9FLAO|nr:T9SS type A sorting domain-containing protein [Lishizhenia tianjinensis]SFT43943.1 Por secretion system C-terminal sorting domain-containing protein [Lishizhenia tianjinensis]
MKKLLLTLLLCITGVLTGWTSVTIQNVSLQTSPAYTCSTNVIVVSGQLGGANYTFVANNVSVVGSNINIEVQYSVGGIVLPALTSFTQNVTLPSLSAGSYTVSVTGVLNSTSYNTVNLPLSVTSCCGAEADFTILDISNCEGDFTGINNTSTGTTSQNWYINGNYAGNAQNWQTDTLSPGTHIIKLVVSNGTCSDSTTAFLGVYAPPVINSTSPAATQVCQGDLVNISATTTNATNFTWTMDGTTTLTTFEQLSYPVNASAGMHSFELAASNPGCPAVTATENVELLLSPEGGQINPFDTTICVGENLTFTNNTSASFDTEEWYLDGTSMSTTSSFNHTFGTAGTFDIAYTVEGTNGCGDSVTAVVNVNDGPVANTIADTNVCDGAVVLDAGSGYDSYLWNNGDDTQTTTVDTAGVYTCVVSNASGCETTLEVNVTDCASTTNFEKIDWTLYPNPTSNIAHIQTTLNNFTYVVYDVVGSKILDGNSAIIDMSTLSNGVYMVELRSNEGASQTMRLIKE